MPSYAQAGGFQALGQGLRGIGEMLVRNRQEEEEKRRQQEAIDLQMGLQRDREMMQPGAIPLSQIGNAAQELPTDAYRTTAGTMLSPTLAQEQADIARQQEIDWALKEDEVRWNAQAKRAKLATELEELDNFYGEPGQTQRAIGSFFVEKVLKPTGNFQPGMTPEAATQIGEMLLRGQQQPSGTERAPVRPTWGNLQEAAEAMYGEYVPQMDANGEPLIDPRTFQPVTDFQWAPGVDEARVQQVLQHVASGGEWPSLQEVTSQGMSRMGPEDVPDLTGWNRPSNTVDVTQSNTSTHAPLPNETAMDFARRLKNQGMDKVKVANILLRYGMLRDAPGT